MKAKKPLLVLLVTLTLLALVLILPAAVAAKVDTSPSQHYAASGEWGVYQVDFDQPEKHVGANHDLYTYLFTGTVGGFFG